MHVARKRQRLHRVTMQTSTLVPLLGLLMSCSSSCDEGPGNRDLPTVVPKPADAAPDQNVEEGPGRAAEAGASVIKTAMVRIPSGSFHMGSNHGKEDERPVHVVTVASFLMDITEVTVSDYELCVRAGACTVPGTSDTFSFPCNFGKDDRQDHPINCMNWYQATAFCAWAGKRLPTEEEWEYAARGPDGRMYPWGKDKPAKQLCWDADETCAVGQFPKDKSPFGVLDMGGNVHEWTSSGWSDYAGVAGADDRFVTRGGSCDTHNPSWIRATARLSLPQTDMFSGLGVRCVRSEP